MENCEGKFGKEREYVVNFLVELLIIVLKDCVYDVEVMFNNLCGN